MLRNLTNAIVMNYVNPKVDIAFKKIFGVEENKDLLISLINSIVSEEDQVEDVTLLNPYNPKNFRNDKLSILDVKDRGIDGKMFNIEIQISDEADYDKRALYYWAKMYTEQLKASEDYSKLSKAIGIHILNFLSIPKSPKYHNIFNITEKDTGVSYFKDLELHTIELKKFADSKEELSDIIRKVRSSLDIWLAFLTRNDLLNRNDLPKELDNGSIKKALNVLDVMNFTDAERDSYEDHLKWLRIEANTLKKQREEGWAEGRAEGLEQGIAEGLEQGVVKGREEERLSIARNLLKMGLSIEVVAESTGIDVDYLKKLISQ